MSAEDPQDIADDAADRITDAGGLADFIRLYGVGGVISALTLVVIGGITAAGDLLLAPWRALADGISDVVSGTLGVGVDIISAGGSTSITSFETGTTALLGPFAFPVAVGITLLAVYVFIQGIMRIRIDPRVFVSRFRP